MGQDAHSTGSTRRHQPRPTAALLAVGLVGVIGLAPSRAEAAWVHLGIGAAGLSPSRFANAWGGFGGYVEAELEVVNNRFALGLDAGYLGGFGRGDCWWAPGGCPARTSGVVAAHLAGRWIALGAPFGLDIVGNAGAIFSEAGSYDPRAWHPHGRLVVEAGWRSLRGHHVFGVGGLQIYDQDGPQVRPVAGVDMRFAVFAWSKRGRNVGIVIRFDTDLVDGPGYGGELGLSLWF